MGKVKTKYYADSGVDMALLAARLRKRRNDLGWTQAALSDKSGVAASYISRLERGLQKSCSIHTICRLASSLNANLYYLVGH